MSSDQACLPVEVLFSWIEIASINSTVDTIPDSWDQKRRKKAKSELDEVM